MIDPRPQIDPDRGLLLGARCVECGYALAFCRPFCPVCGGKLRQETYGPEGTIFASTIIRIPVGDFHPPYALGYIDLDDGPRILAEFGIGGDAVNAPPVGSRARLAGISAFGNPFAKVSP